MKLVFKVVIFVLVLLVASSIGGYFYMLKRFTPPANQLVVSGLPASSSFMWLADTAAGRAMPHAAVLIPVRLPGCPRTCYLQFDTGAPYSMFYAKPLTALQARYPAMPFATALRTDTVRNFRFAIGQGEVQARWLRVVNRGGASEVPADTAAPFIIGSLGADVIDGRVLVLDYPHRRFSLSTTVPDSLAQRADFVPLVFNNRRVLLNMGLQGQPQQLLFDSGSSAFALLTSPKTWQKMAKPGAATRKVKVNAMGRALTSYTVATAAALELGTVGLPLGTVTYIEGTDLTESLLMRFSGMGGMLGNEPFSTRTVIFDVRGGRFGLVRQ